MNKKLTDQQKQQLIRNGIDFKRYELREDEQVIKLEKQIESANKELYNYLLSHLPKELRE